MGFFSGKTPRNRRHAGRGERVPPLNGAPGNAAGDGAPPAPLAAFPAQAHYAPPHTPVQRMGKEAGLPADLRYGVEQLSGLPMDDVTVHYDSAKPAEVQALAYTQGADIHLGAGQERHLPHEAWHVVQQKQRRVAPTMQMKDAAINDNPGLEREADAMGRKALRVGASPASDGAAPRVRFDTLFRLEPGTPDTHDAGVIQRVIRLNAGNRDLDAAQALREIAPLLRFNEFGNAVLQEIDRTLTAFDVANRQFEDAADLAVAVEFELRTRGLAPAEGILVSDEIAETLAHPKFGQLVRDSDLPPLQQQELAAKVLGQVAIMRGVYRKLAELIENAADSPERILKWFTAQVREFATAILMLTRDTFGRPDVPFSVLIAGSGAREEVFPGSDLDLAAVAEAPKHDDVVAIFAFMQKVEKILQVTVSQLSRLVGKGGDEIGLGPDTGVFGFKPTPEALAEKALATQNTGQDASPLISTAAGKAHKLNERFFGARSKIANEDYGLNSLREILDEFQPPTDVTGVKNIKGGFLRFPTLALRDLSQVYGLKSTNSFDRIREIAGHGYLDKAHAGALIDALNVIAGIRLKLHVHYGSEVDTFASDEASRQSPEQYVLTPKEKSALEAAVPVLQKFHARLLAFVEKRRKRGYLTTKSIP
ncbi:hypothetical protein WK62_13670 [Burkholderia ubonensis]|uniref:eCIS core domain-containing protein n=1 Tax=Burkholderia ubonensis TaxID=101571 RepID=UPI00075E2144|nr:DUF4157 domain-containing protein [Burkholderia ubonensis]KVU05572.1 hypothetical protein WK62_13670 [Burkholderia ubonensis]